MLVGNMRDYFRETLQHSLKHRGLQLSELGQVYVVNLLTEFARSETVFAGTDHGDKPVLVELMARAKDAEPAPRQGKWRRTRWHGYERNQNRPPSYAVTDCRCWIAKRSWSWIGTPH